MRKESAGISKRVGWDSGLEEVRLGSGKESVQEITGPELGSSVCKYKQDVVRGREWYGEVKSHCWLPGRTAGLVA